MKVFTDRLSDEEATHYICDLINCDFFLDLSGKVNQCLALLKPEVKTMCLSFLSASNSLDSDGNFIESDADSNGNLMFVLFSN
jgi:hypothetical protein